VRWKVLYSCGSIQRRCTVLFKIIYIYTIHSQMDLLVFKTKRFGEWYHHFKDFGEVKGRWKREKWGVGKTSNAREWSRTVAIEVYFQFEHAVFV
jgi:hypothetical protein